MLKGKIDQLGDKVLFVASSFLSAQRFKASDIKASAGLGEVVGDLRGKTIFVTGGSRGIGLEIALRAARDGANIIIAAKTTEPHAKLKGTIHTAAEEIEKAGGKALALKLDVRDPEQIELAVKKAAEHFGGIDILINNASAIFLEKTPYLSPKQYDLMQQVNVRGTFFASKSCYPYLKKSMNPHILTLSPPINMNPPWAGDHLGYTLSKYGMSLCVLGLAQEWRQEGIAVNALWPHTTIATAAIENMPMGDVLCARSRHPKIMADAAYQILIRNAKTCSGNFFIDDEVLKTAGVEDFEQYSVKAGAKLQPDLFL
ncbi:MAG TPA: short chain dehydrogenase [Bdellovibrionales bacterium]|nr:short chain dehydrogenase [Bdellovibrionales bacterium]